MARRQYCFNCGEDIGSADQWTDPLDTCGRMDCEREARDAAAEYMVERHEQLDRDEGYY